MMQRIINAAIYTVVAVVGSLQVGVPQTWEAWVGLAVLAITTFWGKFSSAQTLIAANREIWSDERRRVEVP